MALGTRAARRRADPMITAGGEDVEVALTASRLFARLVVRLGRTAQVAFLTAPQLRELAAACGRLADDLDASDNDSQVITTS